MPHRLEQRPVHLGLGATAEVEPTFTGQPEWYEAYAARHAGDGGEGRLVSLFSFSEDWTSWEMHPAGAELVLCIAGVLVVHQETADGTVTRLRLEPGEYAINSAGTWHTADVEGQATAVFVTAGQGTEHRPR